MTALDLALGMEWALTIGYTVVAVVYVATAILMMRDDIRSKRRINWSWLPAYFALCAVACWAVHFVAGEEGSVKSALTVVLVVLRIGVTWEIVREALPEATWGDWTTWYGVGCVAAAGAAYAIPAGVTWDCVLQRAEAVGTLVMALTVVGMVLVERRDVGLIDRWFGGVWLVYLTSSGIYEMGVYLYISQSAVRLICMTLWLAVFLPGVTRWMIRSTGATHSPSSRDYTLREFVLLLGQRRALAPRR